MIGMLNGKVHKVLETALILDVSGVGYYVHTHQKLLGSIAHGEKIIVYTYTQYKENDITLFGFNSLSEKNYFEFLQSVQGVGGKVALSIIGAYTVDEIQHAILIENEQVFTAITGIGPKLAKRIINELKDKKMPLDTIEAESVRANNLANTTAAEIKDTYNAHAKTDEAIEVLLKLGFNRGEIISKVAKAADLYKSSEEIIKHVLSTSAK